MTDKRFKLDPVDVPKTLKDLAYVSIKEAILTGSMKQNEFYSEPSLSAMLEISRTPTREALKDLVGEGFVRAIPKRGYQVKSLQPEEVKNLYDYRIPIELAIIKQVSEKISDVHLIELENNLRLDRLASEKNDIKSFLENNRHFHSCLASITNNNYFIDSVNKILELTEWGALNVQKRDLRQLRAVKEHENIYLALKQGDAEAAYRAMEVHLIVSKKLALKQIADGIQIGIDET